MNEKNDKKYWDNRVKEYGNDLLGMVMCDVRAGTHERMVLGVLSEFRDLEVLDIGCGWGRFAGGFHPEKYKGIDFSIEMTILALEKNPGKKFYIIDDAHRVDLLEKNILNGQQVDIVFEVISLSSLELTPQEFFEKYKKFAKKMVICFEFNIFHIFYI